MKRNDVARRVVHEIVPFFVVGTMFSAAMLAYPSALSAHLSDYVISVVATAVVATVLVVVPRLRGNFVVVILHPMGTLTAIYPLPIAAAATLILIASFMFIFGRYYRRVTLPIGAVGTAAMFALLVLERHAWDRVVPSPEILDVLIASFTSVTAFSIGVYLRYIEHRERQLTRDVDRLERSVVYLTEANQSLQRYALNARTTSAQNERNRISREVHDSIGYVLVNIIMMLEAAREYVHRDHEKAVAMMREIRDEADLGHREMRRALRELRSIGENEEEVIGFRALLRLTRVFSAATGIDVLLEVGNADTSFSDEFSRLLYSFFQEGFTNAVRHGKATEISIVFHATEDLLRVALRDNGVGIQGSLKEGIGIQGMRERLAACGGVLEIENGPASLTFVTTVPKRFAYSE